MTDEAPAAAPAPSPAQELTTLTSTASFAADFAGENGRAAQAEASSRKSALTKAVHSPAEEAAPILPEQVQAGLDAPDNLTRAAAAAMVPGQSPDDYSFAWTDAAFSDFETLKADTARAAQAAFDIGASPEYAKATVRGLEDMIGRSQGPAPSPEQQGVALTRCFGSNADTTLEAAKASLAKMSPDARKWAIDAADLLDASGFAWFVGRLASVHKANAIS
jgi:hypothetical protein